MSIQTQRGKLISNRNTLLHQQFSVKLLKYNFILNCSCNNPNTNILFLVNILQYEARGRE